MPRFSANLSLMYPEHALLDRYAAAARDGFRAVEVQFPYSEPAALLRQRLHDNGLQQVLINAPFGSPASEGRPADAGLAALPGRRDDFRRSILDQALPYAEALQCPRIHVMAGRLPVDADATTWAAHKDCYQENLAWAAAQAAPHGIDLVIEALNPHDMPHYFLSRQDQSHATVVAVGAPNLKVMLDLYHCQITEGDLTRRLRGWFGDPVAAARIGHVQVAGVPGRHEPDASDNELNFPHLFAQLDALGYAGWVGAEYRPRGATSAGLDWFAPWRPLQGAAAAPAADQPGTSGQSGPSGPSGSSAPQSRQ